MKVTYVGSADEVYLAEQRVFVKNGESVDVSTEVAKELENADFVSAKQSKKPVEKADKE